MARTADCRAGLTRAVLAVGLILGLAMVAACDVDSPTSPSGSLAGTWTGTVIDSLVGTGTIRITISQSGSTISGTWASTFPDPADNNGGTASGTLSGSSLSATLTPSNPSSCPFNVTATVSGNRMTGTYAVFTCTIAVTGSLELTRT